MNFAPRGQTEQINTDWWSGFLTAIVIAVVAFPVAVFVDWVASHPQPQAIVEVVTTPVLSVADVVGVVLALVAIAMVVSMVVMRR